MSLYKKLICTPMCARQHRGANGNLQKLRLSITLKSLDHRYEMTWFLKLGLKTSKIQFQNEPGLWDFQHCGWFGRRQSCPGSAVAQAGTPRAGHRRAVVLPGGEADVPGPIQYFVLHPRPVPEAVQMFILYLCESVLFAFLWNVQNRQM